MVKYDYFTEIFSCDFQNLPLGEVHDPLSMTCRFIFIFLHFGLGLASGVVKWHLTSTLARPCQYHFY